ncbi:MAG TPA: Hpt domain-containing protein, partial [Caulobacterales bacterium]|nr:Hpt domain-containing protein [Caulobacterales bacterium]
MAGERTIDGLPAGALDGLRLVFFQECEEHLAELEAGLIALQSGEADGETVNSVFRAAHSIKGGAAAFGLDALVQFAHGFESALSELRDGRLEAAPGIVKLMLGAGDVLADLVRAARDGGAVSAARVEGVAAELAALVSAPEASLDDVFEGLAFTPTPVAFEPLAIVDDAGLGPEMRTWAIRFRPYADLYAKANETLLLMRDLRALGEIEVTLDLGDLPPLEELAPEESYCAWLVRLTTAADEYDIRAVFEFVEGDCDLAIEPEAPEYDIVEAPADAPAPAAEMAAPPAPANTPTPAPPPAQTIRVDLERVDKLIDLVSELVINQAMLAQRVADQGADPNSPIALALEDLDQLTRDIQDNVMAIRAQPVKTVFQRMSRLV